ncbi:conjugal transfer protein [Neisseria sp. ZJ106]|uniref:Conjugal transfer protein n=1 Tax=Neisseria lisongii TaxID=2912188 RepID=A0ABY7RL99_9NEIS|nr:conjugal transfer protein [Neisseria lisongii]MCF7521082.1 conjugal transfer protein [Neisseria lisongii]WCL72011.1 conjugal transfer protein [Neisseria lisongii]
MITPFTFTDTRPYPETPVKNNLLLHASSLAHSGSAAQRKLSEESLQTEIRGMLQQNYYLGLSVAMSMVGDSESYRVLLGELSQVLGAEQEGEVQWFAMPLILVAGNNQPQTLPLNVPLAELAACLEHYPHLRALNKAAWLPFLVSSTELSSVNAGDWFAAKHNTEAAQAFAERFKPSELALPEGQSVHVVFALGYGDAETAKALGQNLLQAGLPLMQVWQQALAKEGVTLFVNPLSPDAVLPALAEGSHMRQRMALDVFSANAIRAIRLQSPRVGVVVAAQQGGRLVFGFNATDSAFELEPQIFTWALSPTDNVALIQQNFLDLMAECRVEHLYFLHDVLPENSPLPTYAQALTQIGHNPFFAETAI